MRKKNETVCFYIPYTMLSSTGDQWFLFGGVGRKSICHLTLSEG